MRAAALAMVVCASLGVVVLDGAPVAGAAAKPPKPPKPVVSKLDPRTGPPAGGTVVTIKGKHLKTATKVLFGSAKGTKLKVKSDKKLTVVAPPHAAGIVDVTVKTKGGKSAKSAADRFTYALSRPHVTGLAPSTGPDTGGTRVTVTGTGFDGVTSVIFGDTPGTAVSVASSTQLAVTSPEGIPGKVHVHVTNAAGTSRDETGDTFTFTAVPRAIRAPLPSDAHVTDPDVGLDAVSCPGPRRCFAAGSYRDTGGVRHPLVEQSTGATAWTATSPPLPGDADTSYGVKLVDLDCVTTTFCVAVGTYKTSPGGIYQPFSQAWDGTTWTTRIIPMPGAPASNNAIADLVYDVDCPSATTCTAVGTYRDGGNNAVPLATTLTGGAAGSWSSIATPVMAGTSGARLDAVDCASATQCFAVGVQYATPVVKSLPYIATGAGGSWSASEPPLPLDADPVDPDVAFEHVACGGSAGCVAAGYYQTTTVTQGFLELLSTGATPVAVAAPPADAAVQPNLGFADVSCAISCAAVGAYAATDTGQRPVLVTTLGALVNVDEGSLPGDARSAPADAVASAVSCASQNICLAVGHYDTATQQLPALFGLGNSGWTTKVGPVPPDFLNNAVPSAVTYDAGMGLAVGGYTAAGGSGQGLILVDLS